MTVVLFVCVRKRSSRRKEAEAEVEVEVEARHRRNNLAHLHKPVQPHNLAGLCKLVLALELLIDLVEELLSD